MMGVDFALAVGSGREALYLILKSLNLTPGDEVVVQSFTCMVVINSILWNRLIPVYVDIDDNFNYAAEELSKKITPKTRAVIVQHTFGIPAAEIFKIKKICDEKRLILIEDCAHALGATVEGKMAGTIGDFGFYSLGRSKIISCVSGGMIVAKKGAALENLKKLEVQLSPTSSGQIAQNLLHPIICSLAKLLYFGKAGKAVMYFSQKLKLLNLEVTPGEKKAVRPKVFGTRLSNAMARIGLVQLGLLEKFNINRRRIAEYYFQNLEIGQKIDAAEFPGAVFLRYPLLVNNPEAVLRKARSAGYYLGDWYSTPIAPPDSEMGKTGYVAGSCHRCEKLNKKIINLPTMQGLTEADLQKIVNIVNKNAKN